MKLVVTILQARRVVLPHLFLRHALPRMRGAFPGDVEAVLVQHRRLPEDGARFLATNEAAAAGAGHDRVAEWTRAGRFEAAHVVAHERSHPPYPSIPSYHLACEVALDLGADFHLWLEDDALVWDEACGDWPGRFGDREVGVYRRFSGINSAFFVSRPSFDARILHGLADYEAWTRARRIEPWLAGRLRTPRVHLDPRCAVRSHRNVYPYTGDAFVADLVRRLAPEDAHLLDLELGDAASRLPAPSPRTRAWLAAKDWARPIELVRRARNGLRERFRGA